MGALRVAAWMCVCVAVFMMGELGTSAYKVKCRNQGVFGAGVGDNCSCHYYFCVFYEAYNTWVRYPYNCTHASIPSANFTFDNVTMSCRLNTTTAVFY